MDKELILKTKFVLDEEIKNLTTYKNIGTVSGAFYPKNQKELINVYKFLTKYHFPFIIIGNGSNLLIDDKSPLFVLSTKCLEHKISIKNNILSVSSSTNLYEVYNFSCKKSLTGFEKLAGIPATVGGAIKNNASAFGQSIFDCLTSIKIVDKGKIKTISKDEINYFYHGTSLKNILILSANFQLKHLNKCEILNNYINCMKIRKQNQPSCLCCGSVFKNPQNCKSAGVLIERCHLKGTSINGSQISQKHANFIVNNCNASFDDIYNLITLCKRKVFFKFGVKLEEEVEIISKNLKKSHF